MRSRLPWIVLACAVAACNVTSGRSVQATDDGNGTLDASASGDADAAPVKPGQPCNNDPPRCQGADLVECVDGAFRMTKCEGGCSPNVFMCRSITPTGQVTKNDVADPTLGAITISAEATIDGDTGEISGVRAPGPGIVSGVGFRTAQASFTGPNGAVSYEVAIFSFRSLVVADGIKVKLRGNRGIALAAAESITLGGVLDAQGGCAGDEKGPGGFAPGQGPGAGGTASGVGTTDPGGGGGGFSAKGGRGGPSGTGTYSPAGVVYADESLSALVGGSGGGAGFNGAKGGGGGGAVQLVAFREIAIGTAAPATAGIQAGGCGGQMGGNAAGGGGAGGAILVESPGVRIAQGAVLAANGGGGGGAASLSNTRSNALFAATPAPGVDVTAGAGGAGTSCEGKDGAMGSAAAGGGGGGCGRIRINAYDPPAIDGTLSPALGSGATVRDQIP